MSTAILAAIRQHSQLQGNLKFTALEIGHRMNRSGYVSMAHQMMAWKTGYSLRTAYRHVSQLCGETTSKRCGGTLRIFQKTVYRTANGYGWNLYKCLLPISAFYLAAPTTTHNDSVSGTLPGPEREKDSSLRQDLERQKKGLRFWTPGSAQWTKTCEEIARLEALLPIPQG